MIKAKDGKVIIEGTKTDLITELMCITHCMLQKGVVDREKLLHYIILTCLSDKEVKQILINTIDEMDNIGDALELLYTLEAII